MASDWELARGAMHRGLRGEDNADVLQNETPELVSVSGPLAVVRQASVSA